MNLDEMITQIEADYECAGYSSEEIDNWLDNIRLNVIKNRFKEELLYHNDNNK